MSGLPPGTCLGPFRIETLLGAGGMGEVYLARDTKLDRDVALKVLPEAFAADPDRLTRFQREAQLLAALNHPNIAQIHGLEDSTGITALVIELVEGPTLQKRLEARDATPRSPNSSLHPQSALPIDEALSLARQIAEALEAAHARGIAHRDLKPANIKITPAGIVKVLDFGLAKEFSCDVTHRHSEAPTVADLTAVGSVVGTMAYMSPEQARGEPLDARTDLFSFGAVLYEMTTGRRAFGAAQPTLIVDAILHDTPPRPRNLNPAVPAALERLILRLLEKDRAARYQNASEVCAELTRLKRENESARAVAETSWQRRRRGVVAAAAVVFALVLGGLMWSRVSSTPLPGPSDYVQITYFADSATSPSLSPDGRMMTFIQGDSTFFGTGQVYVKALPDGEPVQLTHDRLQKMSPVFSPDSSRIAYTIAEPPSRWDTWVVSVLGGEPQLWLPNTAALSWIHEKRIMFSEIIDGLHMRVVTSTEDRGDIRPVYTPGHQQGMAHWSHLSPDGKSVLIVEMEKSVWLPCRVVPVDGSSSGRRLGPDAQCTAAAWSPDGRWIYTSSGSSGAFHTWRQRFPSGSPEQLTVGPTEEEGISVAPDGRSLLTSLGSRQQSLWVRDDRGERTVSREGYAFVPTLPTGVVQPFSANGDRLFYLVRRGAVRFTGHAERSGELWMTDLKTARSESLLPGVSVISYDITRDGSQIVFAALEETGKSHVWLARLDRRLPPRQLSPIEADSPRFGAGDEVYCRVTESPSRLSFVYRMKSDGSEPRKAVATPILFFMSASPDGAWLIARVSGEAGGRPGALAFPTSPGLPISVCDSCEVDWTADGKALIVRLEVNRQAEAKTMVLALEPGRTLPRLPASGIRSGADAAGLSVTSSADGFRFPGGQAQQYAFSRQTIERNIYRVPLP